MIQKVTYNLIILCLSVSALATWGTFSQVGISTAQHCGEYTNTNIGIIITLLVAIGMTLAGYGVAVNQDVGADRDLKKGIYQFVLILGHIVVLALAISLIDHHFDDDLNCQTFTGRQNFFLYVLIFFVSVSGIFLLQSIAVAYAMHADKDLENIYNKLSAAQIAMQIVSEKANKENPVLIFKGFVYVGITFLFFFYATAPAGNVASFNGSHLNYTLGASAIVLVLYSISAMRTRSNARKEEKSATTEKLTLDKSHQKKWAISQAVVAIVLVINIGLAIAIIEDDLKVVQQDGHIGNGSSKCFDQNEHVLDMNMTAIGFWALYIIILSGALVQTIYRIYTPVEKIKFRTRFSLCYSDSSNALDMPTFWIAFTWVWVMAASITHHGDYTSENCKFTHEREAAIWVLHLIGALVVVIALPWYYCKLSTRNGNKSLGDFEAQITNSSARPSNRFTSKAQVAVDVNTPLNFA